MKAITYNRGTLLKKYFFIPIILFIFALTNVTDEAGAYANSASVETWRIPMHRVSQVFYYMRDSVEIFNEKRRVAKYLNKKNPLKPLNPPNIAKIKRYKKSHLKTLKIATERAQLLIDNATKAEIKIIELLNKYNIPFNFQWIVIKGCTYYIVDFLIDKNIVIEIDGKHHREKQVKVKDKKRTEWLKKQGIEQVIRFSNRQVFAYPEHCINYLKEAIK